jgi:roadblock/LC7 domain-containing protein
MSKLKEVMKLDGAVAVIEFKDNGETISYEGNIPKEVASMLSDMLASNMKMAKLESRLFTELTSIKGFENDLTGFAMIGNGLSLCVIENIGMIVNNGEADLNKIYQTLSNI